MPRRNASSSTSRASVKTEDSPQGSTPSRGSINNQLCSIGLRVLCHLSLHSLSVPKPVEPSSNSVHATILFDSGASHSFISAKFAAKHKIPMVPLKKPLITRSPGADIKCQLGCP